MCIERHVNASTDQIKQCSARRFSGSQKASVSSSALHFKPAYSRVQPPMPCKSQLQELKATKTLISCQHFGVIYLVLMASGARGQRAGERWKLSLPPSTLPHLHSHCQSVSITLGGMRSSERSADPLPAPLPEPEGSLIALLMSPLLEISSCKLYSQHIFIWSYTNINIHTEFLMFETGILNIFRFCKHNEVDS